ncbi:MAG: AsmA family protein, partial [Pseudomonadota bacterium]
AFFILVLSALFAAPLFINWNDYRPAIEAEMSKLIGRDVTIGGKIQLIVLPAPQLKFDNIEVANTNQGAEAPFLEAKSLEAKIDVGSLLTGKIEARQLELTDPILRLRLDGAGQGNWADIGVQPGGAAFVPKDVLLDSVHVSGGTVEVIQEGGARFAFTGVDGDASAVSLAGPYKLSATYNLDGREQSLRLSTGAMDANGQLRVKTALRDPERSASYQLDGLISGLRSIPSYDGTFLMRLANLSAPSASEAGQADLPDDQSADGILQAGDIAPQGLRQTASFLEIKGPLRASPGRAELTGFELTVHASGRPQILKGDLALDFRPPFKADAALSARWIDFDAMFGASASEDRPSPLAVLRMFSSWALIEAARFGEGALSLDVEQAGLGGDLAGGLSIKLVSDDGGIMIEKLDAMLPGENRLSASGTLRQGQSGPVFAGPVSIDGSGLRALTRWAAGDSAMTGQSFTGDFSLAANARIGEGELALGDARGAVSGTDFTGGLVYRRGDVNIVRLDFQSDRLDLRDMLGDEPLWGTWFSGADGVTEAPAASVTNASLLDQLRDDDVEANLQIGELILPNLAPGKLDTELSLKDGDLDIRSLAFVAPGAMTLSGKGRIESLGDAPSGQLDLSLQAQSTKSLRSLTEILGFSERVTKSKHLPALSPIDLRAELVASRDGELTDASVELSGQLGGSDLAVVARARGR